MSYGFAIKLRNRPIKASPFQSHFLEFKLECLNNNTSPKPYSMELSLENQVHPY